MRPRTFGEVQFLFGVSQFRLWVAAILALALVSAAQYARAEGRRVALIIGNAAYTSLPVLANSVNDSGKVRDTLRDAGFDTFYGADMTRKDLEGLIQRFFRAADGADIAIVYYSGHGVQVGGDNFIVPVDTKLATPYDIEQQTVKVADIFNYISAHAHAQLIFLDACRNNPFKIDRYWIGDTLKTADSKTGLARANLGVGSLIAFSTEPGAVAYDGVGQLSPYTNALVRHITAPNEEIRRALTLVRREVVTATGGRQVPWENSALMDDVYLMPAPPGPKVPAMVRLSVPAHEAAAPVRIPQPSRANDDGLTVKIEQLPEEGKLSLGGKLVAMGQEMPPADLDRLTYDTKSLDTGSIGLITYVVSDKWRQSARGVAAITVEAAPESAVAAEALASSKRAASAAALAWLRAYDRSERPMIVGVGPSLLGFAPPPTSADASAVVLIAKPPEGGVLKLGDRALSRGERISLADMPRLAYQPAIGGEGRKIAIGLQLANEAEGSISVTVKPTLHPCDLEAATPLDLQGVGGGKLPNEIDAPKAIEACERAVRDYPGIARFLFQLGRAQLAAGENAKAQASISAAAEAKHTRAIWQLGELESLGAFGPVDLAKANEYYRRCSDAGDAYCFLAYGRNLFYGRGVTANTKRGVELMLRAAEIGHTYAMNELGYIFLNGRGVPADKERGLRFYDAGAEREDIYSLNNLGLVYLRGTGRPADAVKALAYFNRAALGGHPYAPTNLGRMARDGVGGPKDITAAAKWLALAAERGDYWGALDRAKLETGAVGAAQYLALAVFLNRPGPNYDAQQEAAKLLAKTDDAAKARALEQVTAQLDGEPAPNGANVEEKLVQAQGRAWRKRNPRFDLF